MSILDKLSDAANAEVQEKITLGMKTALAEVPLLDALLDGKEVTLEITLKLKLKDQ